MLYVENSFYRAVIDFSVIIGLFVFPLIKIHVGLYMLYDRLVDFASSQTYKNQVKIQPTLEFYHVYLLGISHESIKFIIHPSFFIVSLWLLSEMLAEDLKKYDWKDMFFIVIHHLSLKHFCFLIEYACVCQVLCIVVENEKLSMRFLQKAYRWKFDMQFSICVWFKLENHS